MEDKIITEFIYYYLYHNQHELENIASGSSQKNLLLRQLQSFKIILPFLNEQKEISLIISKVDSKIKNHQETKLNLETLKKGLMQQLLTGKIRVKV